MKTFSNLLIITLMFALSSCLTSGLEDLPEFEYADITGVQKVEYRYISNEISTAAKITPLNGSPLLGVPGDWSKTNEYRVLAADGSVKDWKIQITKLTK